MNRNVIIGGVAAASLLAGTAGYLIYSGSGPGGEGAGAPAVIDGPVTPNAVTVVNEYTNNVSQDGKRLSLGFPGFELKAKAGETASSVFSTTWRIKLPADDRVVVATATLNGFVKSAGTPPAVAPEPVAQPAAAPAAATEPASAPATGTPADATSTPPADSAAASPAETPAALPPAPPAGPVPGDGAVRLVVTIGGEATVTEWHDPTGAGLNRRLSKATSLIAADKDLRDGGLVPVSVTVEVSGGSAVETLARMNGIDVQLFTESAPLPQPTPPAAPATEAPATEAPATGEAVPAAPAEAPAPAAPAPVSP